VALSALLGVVGFAFFVWAKVNKTFLKLAVWCSGGLISPTTLLGIFFLAIGIGLAATIINYIAEYHLEK